MRPSRKIVFLVSVIVIILLVWFWYSKKQERGDEIDLEALATRSGEIDRDSDGDGLRDWEELLWKTDPQNPDTDGDGVGDREETELAPTTSSASSSPSNSASAENLSATDELARNFLTSYIYLKGNDQLNTQTQDQAIENIIAQSQSEIATPRQFGASDIKINASGESGLTSYKQAIDGIIEKYSSPLMGTEMFILEKILKSEDPSQTVKLENIARVYLSMGLEMLAVPVPASYAGAHLNMVNGLLLMSHGLKITKGILDDPVAALAGVNFYVEGFTKTNSGYMAISK